jgi:hypothetical protein
MRPPNVGRRYAVREHRRHDVAAERRRVQTDDAELGDLVDRDLISRVDRAAAARVLECLPERRESKPCLAGSGLHPVQVKRPIGGHERQL